MTRIKITCSKCKKEIGEIESDAVWIVATEIDGEIEYSGDDFDFCCAECYQKQLAEDENWRDDLEEPYTRTVHLQEEEKE